MYLLDTNICIALLKDASRGLISRLKKHDPEDFVLCSLVKAELLFGARKSKRVDENMRLLKRFFAQFESLPFDDDAAEYYGTDRAILEKAGTPIGANDLLIGSIAKANNAILVTRNEREFSRIPALRVEVW